MSSILKIWLTGECRWIPCESKQLKTFDWAYKQIGCHTIEIALPWQNKTWLQVFKKHHMAFLCDEEGAFDKGKFNLCLHEHNMPLFGNVLVVNDQVKKGTFAPLTKMQIKALVKLTQWIEDPDAPKPKEEEEEEEEDSPSLKRKAEKVSSDEPSTETTKQVKLK